MLTSHTPFDTRRPWSRFRRSAAALACGLGLFAGLTAYADGQHRVQLYQLDTDFDGELTRDSGWGMIELQYEGAPEIVYFNASIAGSWQIQNIPLLSARGPGELHQEYIAFDLGVAHGQQVQFVDFGTCITPFPLDQPPRVEFVGEVFDAPYEIDAGIEGEQLLVGGPGGQDGGEAEDAAKGDGGLINQDCGTDECVPAAVSNSLKQLNERFNLGIDDELITIAALKDALDWRPPRNGEQGTGGCGYDWPDKKKEYLEEKGIKVTSEQVDLEGNARQVKKKMKKLMRALNKKCMIEITVDGHTAQVTEIVPIKNTNKYTLTIQHDVWQKRDGGTIQQKVTLDATGGKISQGWLMNGKRVRHFVIQCKKKKRRRR